MPYSAIRTRPSTPGTGPRRFRSFRRSMASRTWLPSCRPVVGSPVPLVPAVGSPCRCPRDVLNLDVLRKPHHDHAGSDLPAPTGTPISAVEGGTVTAAGPVSGFGNHFVAITDAAGWTWYYGHGSSHSVSVGQA